jgi:hypothetical protein
MFRRCSFEVLDVDKPSGDQLREPPISAAGVVNLIEPRLPRHHRVENQEDLRLETRTDHVEPLYDNSASDILILV